MALISLLYTFGITNKCARFSRENSIFRANVLRIILSFFRKHTMTTILFCISFLFRESSIILRRYNKTVQVSSICICIICIYVYMYVYKIHIYTLYIYIYNTMHMTILARNSFHEKRLRLRKKERKDYRYSSSTSEELSSPLPRLALRSQLC